ncbi:MAG: hypothetical protein K2M53_02405 [Muribaculaceae bacterium]|nr:hypothetical protein [Muribaculaceae bacterium]
MIAENLVSNSNAAAGAKLIDSVANVLDAPYSSLAYILEARLYSDIYKSNSWVYNDRTFPAGTEPEDITEWSRDIFSNRVCRLTEKSFSGADAAKGMGFERVKNIVTNAADASSEGLSLYDFITMQSVNNLRPFANNSTATIPFFNGVAKGNRSTERDASSLIYQVLSENAQWHKTQDITKGGAAMAYYRLGINESNEDLSKLLEDYKDTPYCARFIMNRISGVSPQKAEEYAEVYNLGKAYLKKYPNVADSKGLGTMLINMCLPSANTRFATQVLPGREVKGEVSFRNLSDFYILAIKVGESELQKGANSTIIMNGKVAATARVSVDSEQATKPFYYTREFSFPALESGVYSLAVSTTPDKTGIINSNKNQSYIPVFLVSRLSTLTSSDSRGRKGETQRLIVVEGTNQKPVADAKVTFVPAIRNRVWKTVTLTTDKDGGVWVPDGDYSVEIRSGKDIFRDNIYSGGSYRNPKEVSNGNIFTDLSIYHPGDTVRFAGVVYNSLGRKLEVASEKEVNVILRDANYQPKDTLTLRSDRFGRVNGLFPIPFDGLLGGWSLQMNEGKNYLSQGFFQVADYKSPTFYVAAEGTEGEVKLGETVRIKGTVTTYSGMPVAGAEVKFDVNYTPWRWWGGRSNGNANYGGSTTTDADGSFIIELPTEGLRNTPYAIGSYRLNISATNSAGETQQANPVLFSLGSAYRISPDIASYIKIDRTDFENKGSVAVYDMMGHPVIKKIYYRIQTAKDSAIVASGDFESGRFPFDFATLKSGKYKADFSLTPDFDTDDDMPESTTEFVVWRTSDKVPPVETPLWVPETRIITTPINGDTVNVEVGSSWKDSYIYAEFADINGVYDRRWLKVDGKNIQIPAKAPSADGRGKVVLSGMHDLSGSQATIEIIPEIQTKGLEIEAETFRDKLTPGAREQWKFRFRFNNKEQAELPVMAVMSNKALNALAPFQWMFDPYSSIYWDVPGSVSGEYIGSSVWSFLPKEKAVDRKNYIWPKWNTYGWSLYSGSDAMDGMAGAIHIRGTRKMANGIVTTSDADKAKAYQEAVVVAPTEYATSNATVSFAAKKEMSEEESADEGETGAAGSTDDQTELREIECPLAFFMPNLVTDSEGVATLDFDVPAFNGTWQLQVMGYTDDLRGSVLTRDAVASKPVMVQMNAPRFARTGDKLYVSATIYNNTPDAAALGGKIEFYNPLTGEVYVAADSAPQEVSAMGSRVIREKITIPFDIEMLGIRVYGNGAKSRDGEQTVIPVLPSSTPVTESKTFYLAPGEESFSMTIPEEIKDGVVTLSYTDNPVWECLTALPAISSPNSGNALAQATALYGNAVASGLLKNNPRFLEAIKLFADPANSADSTLVSNLQKNSALKTVALNNTPWVRNAQAETLRMSQLSEYADDAKVKDAITENLKNLSKLQNADGGWSWCDNMPSSEWISIQVLRHFAMMDKNGFLPKDASRMADKGLSYVDKEIVKDWKRIGDKKYPYSSLLNYLYVRSSFRKVSTSSNFAIIKARALKEIESNWKKMGIYEKGTAAILLNREGRTQTAKLILSSLKEYSSESKEKGMWFDNLKSSINGYGPLLTTAQVLEAWSEIDPKSESVDALRQWILLSKQTQDWGGGTAAADLVQSILASGTDWAIPASAPEIYMKGERIAIDHIAALTGSVTIPLTGKSGELRIKRSASGPAWGGVVRQYVAPIADVAAAKTPELSVEKAMYVINNDADGTSASNSPLKQGDRVRVTLTLKCDRDLQYVAVTDGRSASMEPADQISGYTSSDGVWFYKEVRNSSTNLFIPFLSKGTHVITYDCFIDREGEYSLGIAQAQSQYAPVITAHSGGELIKIEL